MAYQNWADFSYLSTVTRADKFGPSHINTPDDNAAQVVENLKYAFGDSATKTAAYTITDTDGLGVIFCDPSSRAFTITLPTLADNLHRRIAFFVTTSGGAVTIDGEGSEYIGPMLSYVMQSRGNYLIIEAGSSSWNILAGRSCIDTGWISCSDYTGMRLGKISVKFPSTTGSFILGEKITEATSNYTGIIIYTSSTELMLKDVTGGFFTNGRVITGQTSGATATLNANTKNVAGNMYHFFSCPISKTNIILLVSTDGTDANSYVVSCMAYDNKGCAVYYNDLNSFKLYTGSSGINIIAADGTTTTLDTEDYFYKIIVELTI